MELHMNNAGESPYIVEAGNACCSAEVCQGHEGHVCIVFCQTPHGPLCWVQARVAAAIQLRYLQAMSKHNTIRQNGGIRRS